MDPAQILDESLKNRYKNLNLVTKRGDSEIQQFYNESTVFITGGTGFLGKQLIEKLLRATNISKIFILVRSKKEKSIKNRLNEMLKDPVYDLLRIEQPHFEDKLVPITGNVSDIKLGMSNDDWKTVTDETEIIFHAAATTRFDETLRVATLTNIRGTQEMLKLGDECRKLRSFVHVSTAYSYARPELINKQVLEDFYPSPVDPEALIKIVETVDESRLNDITPSFIKGWPNTYTFTKAVTEELVRTQGRKLPICIVRPAIVICARREPFPGWLDTSTVYGATGLVLAAGLGVEHVLYMNRSVKLDFVPVDYVNNAIIVSGWETAKKQRGNLKIYNMTSTRNGKTWGFLQDKLIQLGSVYPTPFSVFCTFCINTINPVLFFIYTTILHIIPAYMADAVFLMMAKKRIAAKLAKKVYRIAKIFSYFTMNRWSFEDKNALELYEKLSPVDKDIFDFDVAKIDWTEYMASWGIGIRKYIIKDGLTNTNYARKKQLIFRIISIPISILYFYIIYTLIYNVYMLMISLVRILNRLY